MLNYRVERNVGIIKEFVHGTAFNLKGISGFIKKRKEFL
jgi:hypothetical protein